MRKYWLLLQEQPLSKLLLFGIPLIMLGAILIVFGYRASRPGQPTPTATSQLEQQSLQATAPVSTPTAHPNATIRLAWFYKPPEEGQMDLVSENFDFFILTYKDENARDQLKAEGVTADFAQYLLLLVINDPGDCDEDPPGNQVAFKPGDFCRISEEHPDWFLLDQHGDRIRNKDTYFMDPGSEGFRRFWLERAQELQETYGWDHIFLDNVEASRTKLLGDDTLPVKYPDDQRYARAVEGFLAYIRQNYFQPQGKLIYGNVVSVDDEEIGRRYIQLLDGVMIESFATEWGDGLREHDDWEEQMDLADEILGQGKTLILVAQGDRDNQEMQNFSFASYLLIANGNAVFRYTSDDFYREVWLYDNYKLDLGTPLGKRYKERDAWRRDFSNGYVIVNPQKHTAEIVVD